MWLSIFLLPSNPLTSSVKIALGLFRLAFLGRCHTSLSFYSEPFDDVLPSTLSPRLLFTSCVEPSSPCNFPHTSAVKLSLSFLNLAQVCPLFTSMCQRWEDNAVKQFQLHAQGSTTLFSDSFQTRFMLMEAAPVMPILLTTTFRVSPSLRTSYSRYTT